MQTFDSVCRPTSEPWSSLYPHRLRGREAGTSRELSETHDLELSLHVNFFAL